MSLEKAYFIEVIQVKDTFEVKAGAQKVEVQFNPESLKVTFSNQIQPPKGAGDQTGPASIQFVGSGVTKMSAQLWFDASTASPAVSDVRTLTKKVVDFMTVQEIKQGPNRGQFRPRFTRFNWGTFAFNGIVDSVEESIEFFSPDGQPQRASLTFSMLQQAIQFSFGQPTNPRTPGHAPLTPAPQGSSIQDQAARAGRPGDWQAIAEANNIENPRMLATGQLLDLNADLTGGVGVGAGAGALGNVSAGPSGTAGPGSVSPNVGFTIGG
jgi:hypothetical protein